MGGRTSFSSFLLLTLTGMPLTCTISEGTCFGERRARIVSCHIKILQHGIRTTYESHIVHGDYSHAGERRKKGRGKERRREGETLRDCAI